MNPNEIKITNVFVRQIGELTMDDTLPWGAPGNEIVVEWTAGATANGNAAVDIAITAAIWDHEAGGLLGGATIPLGPVGPSGAAENGTYEVRAALPALVGAPPPFRAFEAVVWLVRPNVGGAPVTTTSFYRGPLFVGW
jgi:hypothetical protein